MDLASTLAASFVPSSVEPFTSRNSYIVDISGSLLRMMNYVVAPVGFVDVEVRLVRRRKQALVRSISFRLRNNNPRVSSPRRKREQTDTAI